MEQPKRYTIHLSVYEVDDEGHFIGHEQAGVSMDEAYTDLEVMEGIMSEGYSFVTDVFAAGWGGHENATPRRLEDPEAEDFEEEEEEEYV